jgi:hypothetical protein
MSNVLFGIALLAVAWGIVSAMVMISYVAGRGHPVNWLLIRLFIFKYMHQYHDLTEQESGKPGPWFYSYVISMNLALVCAVIGAVLR